MPVENEFSASNTAGTLAMALVGSNPNTATDEFFVNLANNTPGQGHSRMSDRVRRPAFMSSDRT